MPSSGFVVITFTALLAVIVPSVMHFLRGVRSGRLVRWISIVMLAILLLVVWGVFLDEDVTDLESRIVVIYALWGCMYYFWFVLSWLNRLARSFMSTANHD
jgi:hypothetical protein